MITNIWLVVAVLAAGLRYTVSAGVQMTGRGEDTKDDGICFTFFMVWFHSVGHVCPDNLWSLQVPRRLQTSGSGPKFAFSHAQCSVKHSKLIFLFNYSNTNITFFKTTETATQWILTKLFVFFWQINKSCLCQASLKDTG